MFLSGRRRSLWSVAIIALFYFGSFAFVRKGPLASVKNFQAILDDLAAEDQEGVSCPEGTVPEMKENPLVAFGKSFPAMRSVEERGKPLEYLAKGSFDWPSSRNMFIL